MARTRKIDAGQALAAAVAAFWRHGFGALGTRQLEAETGITRFTLQTAYGGKMALFLKSLDCYLDMMETQLIPALQDGTVEGLANWFENFAAGEGFPEEARYGCMMIAAINEFGASEPEVTDRSQRFQRMLREGFRAALARIDAAGRLDPGLQIDAAVEVLVAASIGMNVLVRGSGDCAAGMPVGSGVATMVRGWARK